MPPLCCTRRHATRFNATDAWGWEAGLWFGMGEALRQGAWHPSHAPMPSDIRRVLRYAASKNVKLLAYVYPCLHFDGAAGRTDAWVGGALNLAAEGVGEWLAHTLVAFAHAANVDSGFGGFAWDYDIYAPAFPLDRPTHTHTTHSRAGPPSALAIALGVGACAFCATALLVTRRRGVGRSARHSATSSQRRGRCGEHASVAAATQPAKGTRGARGPRGVRHSRSFGRLHPDNSNDDDETERGDDVEMSTQPHDGRPTDGRPTDGCGPGVENEHGGASAAASTRAGLDGGSPHLASPRSRMSRRRLVWMSLASLAALACMAVGLGWLWASDAAPPQDPPQERPALQLYSQWRAWMAILRHVRAHHPSIVMDHRQTNHMWGERAPRARPLRSLSTAAHLKAPSALDARIRRPRVASPFSRALDVPPPPLLAARRAVVSAHHSPALPLFRPAALISSPSLASLTLSLSQGRGISSAGRTPSPSRETRTPRCAAAAALSRLLSRRALPPALPPAALMLTSECCVG